MKEEQLKFKLTTDQFDLLNQFGWVIQYPYTKLFHLPYFFEDLGDGVYAGHKPSTITDRHETVMEAISDVYQREYAPFIKELTDKLDRYKAAMEKVIEMNYQEAFDRYGDRSRASNWGCVVVLEAGLKEPS